MFKQKVVTVLGGTHPHLDTVRLALANGHTCLITQNGAADMQQFVAPHVSHDRIPIPIATVWFRERQQPIISDDGTGAELFSDTVIVYMLLDSENFSIHTEYITATVPNKRVTIHFADWFLQIETNFVDTKIENYY